MKIIPVIDLYKGLVVHAVAGNRKNYKTIDSKICSSANPFDVVEGYLDLFSFKSIYIADLDALEQQGDNTKIIKLLCNKYPNIEVWLDCGTSTEKYLQQEIYNNLRLILSSESITTTSVFTTLLDQYSEHRFILSLDYKANELLGTNDLFNTKKYWPKDLIVLNLNNVGVKQGFKYPLQLKQHNLINDFNVYYGGGIRNTDDIEKLASIGFSGALISTALHSQTISSTEILSLNQLL